MDELIGNLYELNKQQGSIMKDKINENSVALKISQNDVIKEEDEMAYVTRRFQKIINNHGGFQKKTSTSRTTNSNDIFHKCGKSGNFMRDYPSQRVETKVPGPKPCQDKGSC